MSLKDNLLKEVKKQSKKSKHDKHHKKYKIHGKSGISNDVEKMAKKELKTGSNFNSDKTLFFYLIRMYFIF